MINTERYVAQPNKGKKNFRFEAMWAKEEGCEDIVSEAWNEWQTHSILEKIEHTKGKL